MNYDRIIEVAKLGARMCETDSEEDGEIFRRRFQELSPWRRGSESDLVFGIVSVLSGKAFCVQTDNPETLKHYRILADMVGAKIVLGLPGIMDWVNEVARESGAITISFTVVPDDQAA